MIRPLHSILAYDQAIASDGIYTFDLPVNPLSYLWICIRPLNDTGTLSNFQGYSGLAAAVSRATVSWRGAAVYSASGGDIASLNYNRHGILPREGNPSQTDNERRCIVLPMLMGRNPFDPDSCLPEMRRGEGVLELDLDIASSGYDGLRISIESGELIGAKPREFERKITTSRTFAATGPNDIQLPLGNLVRGCLLGATTGFTGASPAPSWGRVSFLVDNEERWVSGSDWEALLAMNSMLGRQPPVLDTHIHLVPTNTGAFEATTAPFEQGTGNTDGNWDLRAWVDFDPWRNDSFSLDTSGANSFMVHAEAETADAVRVLTVERIEVKGMAA